MNTIQEIFRRYAPEYHNLYGEHLPQNHRKAIQAIIDCRSGCLGTSFYKCEACGKLHAAHRSCGNRHCPTCQHEKATHWLNQRLETATVPILSGHLHRARAAARLHARPSAACL